MAISLNPGNTETQEGLELYQFEKLNLALFNNHPDAIYILDLNGNFKLVNEAVCRVLNLERELLIGTSFVPLLHEEYLELTLEKYQLVKLDMPQRYETAINTKAGTIYLDVTGFPLKVENTIVATLGIAKDITDKKQKELELEKYAALLKAKNEELEVFRKVIAHDMRKPVANAIGFAKLLEASLLPAEKEKEVKSLLLKTVESVDAMVRELNQVIALKSVGSETKERVEVKEALNNAVAYFAGDVKRIDAAVTIAAEPDFSIFTIKAYFDSILRNLVSNALKYYSRRHRPTVFIGASAVRDQVEIVVKDNGIGMDLSLVSGELFKMHKRFAPSVAEGNGLGLYIVMEQVKLLCGTVSVTSEPGVGTEFKIILPIA